MKRSKYKLLAGLIAGTFLMTSVQLKPANAGFAIVTVDPLLALGGLVALGGGIYIVGWAQSVNSPCGDDDHPLISVSCITAGLVSYVFLVPGGLLALGDDSSTSLRFNTIDSEQAKSLKITEAQRLAFNSNLDELNEVAQTVTMTVSEDLANGMSKQDALLASQQAWASYQSSLDPIAFLTAQQIANVAFAQPSK